MELTLSVKAAREMLQAMGADSALVIATYKRSASASIPADIETTTVLILAILSKAPKEVNELVKEYLNGKKEF